MGAKKNITMQSKQAKEGKFKNVWCQEIFKSEGQLKLPALDHSIWVVALSGAFMTLSWTSTHLVILSVEMKGDISG